MTKTRPKVSFDRQRLNVLQLLRDRANDLTSGSMIKDFAEMGAHQGGGDVFTAEYVKRHFGKPEDKTNPDSEYVEVLRGVSHVLLEKRLVELGRVAPILAGKVRDLFPREGGGHRDYEWHTERAALLEERARELDTDEALKRPGPGEEPGEFHWRKNRASGDVPDSEFLRTARLQAERKRLCDSCRARARALRKDLYLCDLGIDLLALMCQEDDLFVEFARVRTVLEDEKMEEQNAAIANEYESSKARPGTPEKEAAQTVGDRWGISPSRVRQIAEGQRLVRGEEKRRPGRPRKEAG